MADPLEEVRRIGEEASSIPQDARAIVPSVPNLARDQRILDRFTEAVTARGLVGERRLARLTYLVVTSRVLEHPVSLAVKGPSSGGKSYTVEQTVQFFPGEAMHALTGMSERALVYDEEPVKHRTILLYEYVAMKTGMVEDQTSYFVRSLLSEGILRYQVTEKVDGKFKTRIIEREGPTNLIVTTTAVNMHPENETRMFTVTVDDTAAQTKRIMQRLAARHVRAGGDLDEWHDLQRWIAQAGEHRVVIPYGRALADAIPPMAIRLRRDFGALLSLVESHAVLHQLNRDRDPEGRIIATAEDYEVVRDLVADVVSEGIGATVSPVMRETVEAVRELEESGGVTAAAVGRALELDPSAARRRLVAAASRGFVRNLEERPRRPGRYVPGDPMPEEVHILPDHLPTADQPEGSETAGQAQDGTMARPSQEVGTGPMTSAIRLLERQQHGIRFEEETATGENISRAIELWGSRTALLLAVKEHLGFVPRSLEELKRPQIRHLIEMKEANR